jgi:hypothetical protein
MKDVEVPELISDDRLFDLSFLADLTAYLNELNLKIQEENKLVHQLYSHVKNSQAKFRVWAARSIMQCFYFQQGFVIFIVILKIIFLWYQKLHLG